MDVADCLCALHVHKHKVSAFTSDGTIQASLLQGRSLAWKDGRFLATLTAASPFRYLRHIGCTGVKVVRYSHSRFCASDLSTALHV